MKGGKMTETNNSLKITIVICVAVLLVVFMVFSIFKSMSSPYNQKDQITVEGIATVKAAPDLVVVYFNAEGKGNTSSAAKDANSLIVDEMETALIKLGIEKKNIVTENYNIYQDYDWVNGRQVEKGFKAVQTIKIELKSDQLDLVGDVIDAGVDAGAVINYINFELSQESQNKYKAESMKLAAQDARIKAESVAEGFNKEIKDLVSTSTSDFGYTPWNVYSNSGGAVYAERDMAKEAVPSIQPGDREITSRVSAVFEMK
jgi:uncharacterized protein